MQQHLAAFDMGKKLHPQAAALAGAFDQAGDVGHDEFMSVDADYAEVVEGTALALDARAELHYQRGYPVTFNTNKNIILSDKAAMAVSGRMDTDTPPLMGAEDFSYMLNERPGAYIFLGNGDTAMVHHPAYNFDDSAIPFGSSWYAGMAEARLPVA